MNLTRIFVALLLASSAPLAGCKQGQRGTLTYECADGMRARVTILDAEAKSILLQIDRRFWYLDQQVSASGAKYGNGHVVFWSKGRSATIEQNGVPLCRDCRLVAATPVDPATGSGALGTPAGTPPDSAAPGSPAEP